MKYLLCTKYKTGKIELDTHGLIINGGEVFRKDVGKSLKDTCEKYYNKRIQVKLEEINET